MLVAKNPTITLADNVALVDRADLYAANARIAALEAQVAEMQPVVEAVEKLEEWLKETPWNNLELFSDTHIVIRRRWDFNPRQVEQYIAHTLPAALAAALKQVTE